MGSGVYSVCVRVSVSVFVLEEEEEDEEEGSVNEDTWILIRIELSV